MHLEEVGFSALFVFTFLCCFKHGHAGQIHENIHVTDSLLIDTSDGVGVPKIRSSSLPTLEGELESGSFRVNRLPIDWNYCNARFTFQHNVTISRSAEVTVNGSCGLILESLNGNIEILAPLNMTCSEQATNTCSSNQSSCLGAFGPMADRKSPCACGPGCGECPTMTQEIHGSGHGGLGGRQNENSLTKGLEYQPTNLTGGTSGACGPSDTLHPGYGGGAIQLKAANGQIHIGAPIRANGQLGRKGATFGGSSGGTIRLDAQKVLLSTEGSLQADGSNGSQCQTGKFVGGGGGGVIEIIAGQGVIENGAFITLQQGEGCYTTSTYAAEPGQLNIPGLNITRKQAKLPDIPTRIIWPPPIRPSSSVTAASSIKPTSASSAVIVQSTASPEQKPSGQSLKAILEIFKSHTGSWNASYVVEILQSLQRISSSPLTTSEVSELLLCLGNISDIFENAGDTWSSQGRADVYGEVLSVVDSFLKNTDPQVWDDWQKLPELLSIIEKIAETMASSGTAFTKSLANIESQIFLNVSESFTGVKLPLQVQDDKSWIQFEQDSFGNSSGNISIAVVIYKKILSDGKESVPTAINANKSCTFSSEIVTSVVCLNGTHVHSLDEALTLSIRHRNQLASNAVCVYWDHSGKAGGSPGVWSDKGLSVVDGKEERTICRSDHLTSFAVLVKVSETQVSEEDEFALTVITYVGCGISITCLIATLLVFFSLESLLSIDRYRIHINLIVAILAAQVLFLAGMSSKHNQATCKVIAVLLHYFFSAWFSWMSIEGVHLYMKIVTVYNSENIKLKYYYCVGWGVPILVVVIAAGVNFDGYGTNQHCWLSMENGFIWAFVGPILAVITMNVVILIMVVRIIVTSASATKTSEFEHIKAGIKGVFVLLPLLGITWVFGLMIVNSDTVVFEYLFATCNSLQGLFIFLVYCIGNSEVRGAFKRMREKRNLSNGRSDLNQSISDSAFQTKGISSSKDNKSISLKDRLTTKIKKETCKVTKVKPIMLVPDSGDDNEIFSTRSRSRSSNVSSQEIVLEDTPKTKLNPRGFDDYKGPRLFELN